MMDHGYCPMSNVRENSPSWPCEQYPLFVPGGGASGDGAEIDISALKGANQTPAVESCSWTDGNNSNNGRQGNRSEIEDISIPCLEWLEHDGIICSCFEDQTTHLKSLHSLCQRAATHDYHSKVEGRTSPKLFDRYRLDVCIQRINAALSSCRAFLLCNHCQKDECLVLLALSAFQLAITLFERIVHEAQEFFRPEYDSPETSSPEGWQIPSRLGEYEVSQEDALAIRKLIVQRALQKGLETLELLRALASAEGMATLSPSSTDPLDTAQVSRRSYVEEQPQGVHLKELNTSYLRQVVCRCDEILKLLLSAI